MVEIPICIIWLKTDLLIKLLEKQVVIRKDKAPFSEKVSYYLKRSSIFVVLISVVPALIGSIVLRLIYPATDLTFPISVGGIISGITMFMIGMFFNYGKELQQNEDETLW